MVTVQCQESVTTGQLSQEDWNQEKDLPIRSKEPDEQQMREQGWNYVPQRAGLFRPEERRFHASQSSGSQGSRHSAIQSRQQKDWLRGANSNNDWGGASSSWNGPNVLNL